MIARHKGLVIHLVILLACLSKIHGDEELEENDPCSTPHYKGVCTTISKCPDLRELMSAIERNSSDVGHCGFNVLEEIICCPKNIVEFRATTISPGPTEFTTISSKSIRDSLKGLTPEQAKQKIKDLMKEAMSGMGGGPPKRNFTSVRAFDRPADRACKEIEKDLMPSTEAHILRGTKVRIEDYPHMAKIIYDSPTLICGGILIHRRFVLTAAHCLQVRGAVALKVIMGVTDFNDTEEWKSREEIDIKTTYLHENYTSFRLYNDIGLIELAREVKYALNVFPTCLHTDPMDLPLDIDLIVTGWGQTETGNSSSHLLAANLTHVPVLLCNASYQGHMDHRLNRGIVDTQLCAFSLDSDACLGDSGGPIHLVKDKRYNNYRVVGLVSFGFLCGSDLPGVYTRVFEYLDFIEGIVWPDG